MNWYAQAGPQPDTALAASIRLSGTASRRPAGAMAVSHSAIFSGSTSSEQYWIMPSPSATGVLGCRSLTILANEKTSGSPTLYIVRMKSNESSRSSASSASAVELTRVSDGGFDMLRSMYSWLMYPS